MELEEPDDTPRRSTATTLQTELWLERLLNNVGQLSTCAGPHCRAEILWVTHANGKRCPYNPNGEPHWATCPDSNQFKGRKQNHDAYR